MGTKWVDKTPEQKEKSRERTRKYKLDPGIKEQLAEKQRLKALEALDWLHRYKLERGCIDCGFKEHPVALDLDHNGPKSIVVAHLNNVTAMHNEIQDGKCVVRCRNCHQVKTWCEKLGILYDPRINQMILPAIKNIKRHRAEYKLKRGCKYCGYNAHFAALDLHHIGDKGLPPGQITSINRFELEMLMYPCEVLCGNCHRIHHHSERLESWADK